MVSEGFQRGLKPCDFREVSDGSELVCGLKGFQRGSETVDVATSPKEFELSLGKNIQTQIHTSLY